jgi:HD-like signal output (HDOD) protein
VPLSRVSLEEVIERLHTIPTLPEVVNKLIKMVNDPDADSRMIGDLVSRDPGIAAKMLRMVNSVYYGLNEPIHDLDHAVSVLGFKTLRSLAMSVSVINSFQQQNACFSMKAYWTHSVVSGGLARLVAQRCKNKDPELAFTFGLLRHIGRLVLVENAPDETRAIVAVAHRFKRSFHDAAKEVIDTDDAEIGAWLAEHWGLAPEIASSIRHQYKPEMAPDRNVISSLAIADAISAKKGLRACGDCNDITLSPEDITRLNLDKVALVEIMNAATAEFEYARELLLMAN